MPRWWMPLRMAWAKLPNNSLSMPDCLLMWHFQQAHTSTRTRTHSMCEPYANECREHAVSEHLALVTPSATTRATAANCLAAHTHTADSTALHYNIVNTQTKERCNVEPCGVPNAVMVSRAVVVWHNDNGAHTCGCAKCSRCSAPLHAVIMNVTCGIVARRALGAPQSLEKTQRQSSLLFV